MGAWSLQWEWALNTFHASNFFLHPSRCDVISGLGQLVHLMGKDEVSGTLSLPGRGVKLGLLSASGIGVESISFGFLRWISGTVQALKERTVIWIWHCPPATISWRSVCATTGLVLDRSVLSIPKEAKPLSFYCSHPRCPFYSLKDLILSCGEVA